MLIDQYKEKGYLFNVNLTGKIDGGEIYRGDLVLELGEVTERGDRKPPSLVAKQAVLYVVNGKIQMLIAGLYSVVDLNKLIEIYSSDFAPNCSALVFVHDIKSPVYVEGFDQLYLLEPLDDGMIWNEALDLLCIEKSDIKSQSAEEKVVTLANELAAYKPKHDVVALGDIESLAVEVRVTARGPV